MPSQDLGTLKALVREADVFSQGYRPGILGNRGRRLVDRGQAPEAALTSVAKEIPAVDIARWSMETDTPVGRLRHLGPTVQLSETRPHWARPSAPLGHHQPVWPARAA